MILCYDPNRIIVVLWCIYLWTSISHPPLYVSGILISFRSSRRKQWARMGKYKKKNNDMCSKNHSVLIDLSETLFSTVCWEYIQFSLLKCYFINCVCSKTSQRILNNMDGFSCLLRKRDVDYIYKSFIF